MQLTSGNRILDLSSPKVMGILNVTPDSFFDGGRYSNIDNAFQQAEKMFQQGASILDVGGESTRPGAEEVNEQQELDRVIPVIEKINKQLDCWISIDTSKAKVMQEAVNAGAHLINDVRALREEGALDVAVKADIPVCLMHMQGQPRSMQRAPEYVNVIEDVKDFLLQRTQICINAGIKKQHIILDLGFGFGKQLKHNYQLLGAISEFVELGYPVLTSLSRKSMFGELLNRDTDNRLAGSLAGALTALQQGSKIVRVHDVEQTIDVIKVLQALKTFK